MKNIHLHILQANPLLKLYYSKLKKEFDLVLNQISKYLNIQDIDILVIEDETSNDGPVETKILNDNLLTIVFNTKNKDFKNKLKEHVRRPLSYDLYLMSIYKKFGEPKTLLQEILMHGVAIHFEKTLTKFSLSEDFKLNQKEINTLIDKNKRFFKLKNYNPDKWFYNHKNKPAFIGRVIGYFLIENYLKEHKDKKLETLLKLSPNKLEKLI
ncbi:MAG: hypothetical protein COX80_00665 [Candidatus Magasanikbacteria bacterium CG_4_10_14_0_2_um_filter_33_14]|uniref:DUF2268 domain-containing protein n=1 Tax=Candidatus Magasanikbacteria bacterium CG_4_10_14_0_2_um_filter_33_14 TaxID=1974636 RepID=A0A2M7VBR8_9BACT|nr:MAG: hypothetical protein COX80_00665 [Candidatus Magasanikbacteria bacterium CG_4_10_14_0_2_um_filter_33_14]